ncbi:MAG: hypothetical protein ABI557_19725 [Aureliella sp.]
MNADWQTVLSLAIVALAAAFLLRQVVMFVTRPQSRGCGSCSSNKSCSQVNNLPLVKLSSPSHKNPGSRDTQ